MIHKKKAIVIGGHVQGLGIVRALGKIGYHVSVIDKTTYNIAKHSRYCNSFYEKKNKEIVSYLLSDDGLQRHEGSVVFPTNDEHVEFLSKNLDELQIHYKPATDIWDVIEQCFNKRNTYTLAKKRGIAIPQTYFPANEKDLVKLGAEISFPCIIKPAVMYRFYNTFKQKVFICNTEAELLNNYKKALSIIPEGEVIVQDIIPGSSEYQYSVGCLFDRDKPIVTIAAQRKRQHPIDFGNATTYAETVAEPEIVESAYKLLRSMRYRGICEVEFKKDPRDGTFKFLEVNPRTWKWHSIAEKANTPFIQKYIQLLHGEEPEIDNTWGEGAWNHYITDIPTVIRMKLKGVYSKPVQKSPKAAVFDIKDIKPAIYELLYLPYLIKVR